MGIRTHDGWGTDPDSVIRQLQNKPQIKQNGQELTEIQSKHCFKPISISS